MITSITNNIMMLNRPFEMNIKKSSNSQYRYKKQKRIPVFPQRLYDMLDHAEERGYDHVFSWMPDGKSFKVHLSGSRCTSSEQTVVNVLKKNNFQQTKFRSFLRQLNQYGFERTHRGKGEFRHEFFIRGSRDLLEGKSIDDFQRPQDFDINGNDDDDEEGRPFQEALWLSRQDNTSLFLTTDQSNYWKPASADFLYPTNYACQESPWQLYTKHLIPAEIFSISRGVTGNEKQQGVPVLPVSSAQAIEYNDDDTIPTIDSSDREGFDDWMGSEFTKTEMTLRKKTNHRCQMCLVV